VKTSSAQQEFSSYIAQVGQKLAEYPWHSESAYANWLAQTYFYVRHTTSMICLCAAKFGPQDRKRHAHAVHHLAEEKGHDLLLLNDLDHLGHKISDFEELPVTQLFYQNQYHFILNEGPASHLGYALLLESMAAHYGPEIHRKVVKLFGPDSAKFWEVHTNADQDHAKEGMVELAQFSKEEQEQATKNLRQSAFLYRQILTDAQLASTTTKVA
jgi:hypothetical protein